MEITERQNRILDAIIGEYIDSAHPVSSQLLEKKYDFEIRPAMLRIEMQKLTDEGYLFQPHTSAGRVPTDKGYRFFVDELLEFAELRSSHAEPRRGEGGRRNEVSATALRSSRGGAWAKDFDGFDIADWLKNEVGDNIKFLQSLTKELAEAADALVLSYLEKEKIFWKEGWEEVLREPEFEEKEFRVNFGEFLENFEEHIGDLEVNSEIKIYIGKENPFKKAEDFSIIISKCQVGQEGGIVSLLGPKRMDYDRNINLMNSLVWQKIKKSQSLKT